MDNRVILTRRADGVHFTIHMQARSPNGPCELHSVDRPVEKVHTTNDRLDFDFIDPRKVWPMPAPRDPLDVSDIPMAADVVRKIDAAAAERLDSDVARLLDAVRRQMQKADPRGEFDAVGRGLDFVDGAIRRVNELIEPRGWRVQTASRSDRCVGWYTLRQVGA